MKWKMLLAVQALAMLLFATAIGVSAQDKPGAATSITFTDVPTSNNFYPNILHITDAGIAGGYTVTSVCGAGQTPCYKPFNFVTRGQMAKFVDLARTQPGIAISTSTVITTPYDTTPLTSITGISGGTAIIGTAPAGTGVRGNSDSGYGVYGVSNGEDGVRGYSSANDGVQGESGSANRSGVYGQNNAASGGCGACGQAFGANSFGISGLSDVGTGAAGTSNSGAGVSGISSSGNGVFGKTTGVADVSAGVHGESFNGVGVYGASTNADGVFGFSSDNFHSGVTGIGSGTGSGVYGQTGAGGFAGDFAGNIKVTGNCSGCLKATYQIDNPADPANEYLNYAAVASSEMLNLYTGNVTLDANGEAIVKLPAWVETANKDFRYTLTPFGSFAPLFVAAKIEKGQFKIGGGKPGQEVSWQVTAVRSDPWSVANAPQTEAAKTAAEKGKYLYPQGYNQPDSAQIRSPQYVAPTTSK